MSDFDNVCITVAAVTVHVAVNGFYEALPQLRCRVWKRKFDECEK